MPPIEAAASPDATSRQPWLDAAHVAHRAGKLDEAARCYRLALTAGEDTATGWNDLGVALRASGRPAAAAASYRRALAAEPGSAETWSNLGNALKDLGRPDEAIDCHLRATALAPEDPHAACLAGVDLRQSGRSAEALSHFDRALAAAPGDANLEFERGLTLIQLGRWRAGFEGYERRFELGFLERRSHGAPVWDGAPLAGRRLLVVTEQGHGDAIQFARFLPRLKAMAAGPIQVECLPNLKRLFQTIDPGIQVVSTDETPAAHDLEVPMMSLARRLGVSADEPPAATPYLRAPPGTRPALGPRDGRPRVGVVWAGKRQPRDRSCPFDRFLGLVETPDIAFYSLQRGPEIDDIHAHGATGLVADLGAKLGDFADDAAVVGELDLVVSIDTAMCHLSAALGRPTWTLLTYPHEWRFGEGVDICPWHPTMRLFRMARPDDWTGVISAARDALDAWAAEWRRRADAT